MKFKRFIFNPFQVNTYIYYSEINKKGILIDPAMINPQEEKALMKFIEKEGIIIEYIINTHGHFDHTAGNKFAKNEFGADLLIHADDIFLLENLSSSAIQFGISAADSPQPDIIIEKDTEIKTDSYILNIISTPGHSRGSICIINKTEELAFTGDLIFRHSIGRTDLPGGNYEEIIHSITTRLFQECSDEFNLYPGHMEPTSVNEEKRRNPFISSFYY